MISCKLQRVQMGMSSPLWYSASSYWSPSGWGLKLGKSKKTQELVAVFPGTCSKFPGMVPENSLFHVPRWRYSSRSVDGTW